jgi:hypothetical protein
MLQHSVTISAGAAIHPILSPGNPKGLEMVPTLMALERVMNSIRNGLAMRETEIAREPS